MENIIHDPFNDSYKSKGAPFYISNIFTQTELFDSKGCLGLRLREATATLSNVFLEFFFLWKKKWSLFLAITNFLKKNLVFHITSVNEALQIEWEWAFGSYLDSYLESPEAKNHSDGFSILGLSVKNCLS